MRKPEMEEVAGLGMVLGLAAFCVISAYWSASLFVRDFCYVAGC